MVLSETAGKTAIRAQIKATAQGACYVKTNIKPQAFAFFAGFGYQ
jgi:hypothetical protein